MQAVARAHGDQGDQSARRPTHAQHRQARGQNLSLPARQAKNRRHGSASPDQDKVQLTGNCLGLKHQRRGTQQAGERPHHEKPARHRQIYLLAACGQ